MASRRVVSALYDRKIIAFKDRCTKPRQIANPVGRVGDGAAG